jgi:hypothetical protein
MRLGGYDDRRRRHPCARVGVESMPGQQVELELTAGLFRTRRLGNRHFQNASAQLSDAAANPLEEDEQVRYQQRIVNSDAHRHEVRRGVVACRLPRSLSARTRREPSRRSEVSRSAELMTREEVGG